MRQKETRSGKATLLLVLREGLFEVMFEPGVRIEPRGNNLGEILGETSNAKTILKLFLYGWLPR